ncbi:MAG: response regulator transcription factor [Oscillospiraceae bacterium]|nr:response regulator transcription factor [Oscillospiraceae bacterium]
MRSILIIEDDRTIREELKFLLEKYGYAVSAAEDFGDIVTFALAENPNLILLDINLPFYDGYYVCRELRKRTKTPIIVVTSRSGDIDELMSMNLGADDFVTKPYNTQILLARIEAVLNRAFGAATLRHGELVLDVARSAVTFGQRGVELTKNELKIMRLLLMSGGAIVSRDEMMNELWQSNEFVDDNTLTVNINRLRKKLADIGAADGIKTKRGQGYSL